MHYTPRAYSSAAPAVGNDGAKSYLSKKLTKQYAGGGALDNWLKQVWNLSQHSLPRVSRLQHMPAALGRRAGAHATFQIAGSITPTRRFALRAARGRRFTLPKVSAVRQGELRSSFFRHSCFMCAYMLFSIRQATCLSAPLHGHPHRREVR